MGLRLEHGGLYRPDAVRVRAKAAGASPEEPGMNMPFAVADREARVRRVRLVAALFDDAATIPFLGVRFGLDPVLGLVPVWGDVISALAGLYIVYEGWRLGATRSTLAWMMFNVILDAVLGSIPVLGDLFDVGWRSNTRNLRLLGIEPWSM